MRHENKKVEAMLTCYCLTFMQARNQGDAGPPYKIVRPPLEKCVGHRLKVLDIVQKTLRPSWLRACFYVWPALFSQFSVLSKFCIMNTLLHCLLLCQSCRSLRNVGLSFGGRILGLMKSAYHGWLSMMTSSEGPF